ncbi:hypothetical protein G4B88_004602 [Cannabis sativa]|uniref:Uncharacterized protein n=1 Tax=Cannabis sativa TaxID=3483 RepID=A0A7J6G4T0_CANSA|nr:hypothetical protein G4B88_004602 [Cannabis sativa]
MNSKITIALFTLIAVREHLHTSERRNETRKYLETVLGDAMIECEIEKISYGQFTIKKTRHYEIDLFILQTDGKKIVDTIPAVLPMSLISPIIPSSDSSPPRVVFGFDSILHCQDNEWWEFSNNGAI